jgi:hypothetical protein
MLTIPKIDIKIVAKKTIFFLLIILSAWTSTKIPFYIGFDRNGDDYYDKLGLEGSINLVHWIHSNGKYHGSKLKTPAINFLLLHVVIGITLLILIALTLINSAWRRQYGYVTFTFAILLGGHTLPAAMSSDVPWMRWVFTITCIYVIATALLGFRTLSHYDRRPILSEKYLAIQHYIIAFGAWGAGFAELFGIMNNISDKKESGTWPTHGDGPHPLSGTTIYDQVPEQVGWAICGIMIAAMWVIWPMYLLKVETQADVSHHVSKSNGSASENTPLNPTMY